MQPTPEQLLQAQARAARSQRDRAIVERQEEEQSRQQHNVVILGFNASIGLWRCQMEDGSIVYATSITTGGGKGKGDMTVLQKTASGTNFIKHMP